MIRKIEAFFDIFFKAKGKHVFSLFLGLCIPVLPIQAFMAFFLALRVLGRDIENKSSIVSYLSLPFKKREIFFLSWISGVFLIFVASLIGWTLTGTINILNFTYLVIFFSFYYGVSLFFVARGYSLFGMAIFIFIIDAVLLSVPGYAYISVITQGNSLYSALFSLLGLGVGYYGFIYHYEG